ncbi:unnamed protein product, partial [Candidula unifasciata]
IDECEDPLLNTCQQTCHNFQGGYNCSCLAGFDRNPTSGTCSGESGGGVVAGAVKFVLYGILLKAKSMCTIQWGTHYMIDVYTMLYGL